MPARSYSPDPRRQRPAGALDLPHGRRGAAASASCAPMPPSRSNLATLAGDGPLGARIRNPHHRLWRVSTGITLCITYVLSACCGLVSAARPAGALDFPHGRRGAVASASCAPMPPSRSRLATLAGDGPMVNAGVRSALQFPEPQSRQGAVQRRNLSEARRMTGLCKGKRMRYPFWFVQLIIS